MSFVLTDRDRGYKALIKRARQMLAEHTITVGIHSDEDPRNLMIGTYHEFGTENMDARSFIGAWVDEQEADLLADIRKVQDRVIRGKVSVMNGLKQLGLLFVGKVQKRMAGGLQPDKVDGSTARLIQTGQLRSSIGSKVDGD